MSTDQPLLPDNQMLFDEAPCGLVVTKEDGTILRSNQTFSHSIGLDAQALIGRRFQDLLTMGGRIFHQTHWSPLMQMQGSVAEVKLDLVHHDKHIVTMLLNGVRREHASGAFYELALFGTKDRDKYERELLNARKVAEDLLREKTAAESALRQAQAELKSAYEEAQLRASLAEQMVAIVSHDLKNPLTAIKMASGILAREERTTRESKMLGHISQSVNRAERMIADLLDLALARVGQGITLSPSTVDLHAFVGASVDELRMTFPEATLVHQTVGTGNAWLDADRVQQIIGNLVANSVAYGDLQQPITITSRVEQDHAVVSVKNQGPVIPDSLMGVLFEPMIRGAKTGTDSRSVGLGLFIVREIVRAHNGVVSVNSMPESGTTFTATFPMV
ncbi:MULTISPECIES: PAS domain-containing sensor histidine kinase [unclassified Pseudomonas]|jgi:sigma-B regulation protein RsbU (phosphoserine phosphatase)|uniref:Histidine kinase n=1 Tax=Pseudomonas gorinensis TaxID=3240790 RepID=A0ACA7P5V6_9PSED|nr:MULTISPECIES: PAS domain-containing sensor histidine kinase [unclassified Pseudomonas]AHC35232.1 histidine kinase [Pseudomonas sp. TKP]MBL1309014.1 PAS domain-containing sensor histidine kinase [Pseudomonas sp.]PMX15713.1 PAS domain-containing sensor histidine kinase [Pseudomonas sp. MPBC4-3]PMX47775.1 PAS domain-containing sensor histidine kinase [Pseudomonas sp. FW301-21B01]PMY08349.1 PAS domain-containing sensor histidine kinase [Pseudomonas sp. MPR-R5A]